MRAHRSSTRPSSTRGGPGTRSANAVAGLRARALGSDRPVARLLRLYVALNVATLLTAFALGGPAGEPAHAAVDAVLAWCRIG